jgi:hypothetical protein
MVQDPLTLEEVFHKQNMAEILKQLCATSDACYARDAKPASRCARGNLQSLGQNRVRAAPHSRVKAAIQDSTFPYHVESGSDANNAMVIGVRSPREATGLDAVPAQGRCHT